MFANIDLRKKNFTPQMNLRHIATPPLNCDQSPLPHAYRFCTRIYIYIYSNETIETNNTKCHGNRCSNRTNISLVKQTILSFSNHWMDKIGFNRGLTLQDKHQCELFARKLTAQYFPYMTFFSKLRPNLFVRSCKYGPLHGFCRP